MRRLVPFVPVLAPVIGAAPGIEARIAFLARGAGSFIGLRRPIARRAISLDRRGLPLIGPARSVVPAGAGLGRAHRPSECAVASFVGVGIPVTAASRFVLRSAWFIDGDPRSVFLQPTSIAPTRIPIVHAS